MRVERTRNRAVGRSPLFTTNLLPKPRPRIDKNASLGSVNGLPPSNSHTASTGSFVLMYEGCVLCSLRASIRIAFLRSEESASRHEPANRARVSSCISWVSVSVHRFLVHRSTGSGSTGPPVHMGLGVGSVSGWVSAMSLLIA